MNPAYKLFKSISFAIKTRSVGDWPGMLRMIVDAGLISASYLAGMAGRFLIISLEGHSPARLSLFVDQGLSGLLFLVPICILIFNLFGFYNRARRYGIAYKALVILQGVTASYLLAGFLAFFLPGYIGFSRGGFLLSYAFSIALLMVSRFASLLVRKIVIYESKIEPVTRNPGTESNRVLLIGGAGYIGSALVPKLLEGGYNVRLMDLMVYGDEAIGPFLQHERLEVLREDFRHTELVVRAMQDVDAVIHLGAIVGDPACALNERLTIDINQVATRMIAEVAKGLQIKRFIFASTCSVYGASDTVLDEHSALNPISLYAKTKIACEKMLLGLSGNLFHPTVLRFSTIFGLSGRTRFDLVVNLLTAKAMLEKNITVSGGDQWRPFIHVEDAAQAVLQALEAPLEIVGNEIFNVGADNLNYTINDVAEMIRQKVPMANIQHIPFDGDRRNYRVGFAKFWRATGYKPKWSLEAGLDQIIKAIRDGHVTDYKDPRYSNVVYLRNAPSILRVRDDLDLSAS